MGYYQGTNGTISPKDYARQNFRGVWAASLTPFRMQNPFVGEKPDFQKTRFRKLRHLRHRRR